MTNWPSKKELDKILPKLDGIEGTKHLNKDAGPLDLFRWELCQRIIKYKIEHGIKQKELAEILGIDEPQISRILRHRIEKVSTDKMAKFVLMLDPEVELKVS